MRSINKENVGLLLLVSHVRVSGEVDNKTFALMKLPRCGDADKR